MKKDFDSYIAEIEKIVFGIILVVGGIFGVICLLIKSYEPIKGFYMMILSVGSSILLAFLSRFIFGLFKNEKPTKKKKTTKIKKMRNCGKSDEINKTIDDIDEIIDDESDRHYSFEDEIEDYFAVIDTEFKEDGVPKYKIPRMKKYIIVASICLITCLVGGFVYISMSSLIPKNKYDEGVTLFEQGAYFKASEKFYDLEYKDSNEKYIDSIFYMAKELIDEGEFHIARLHLFNIQEYRDVQDVIDSSYFLQGLFEMENGDDEKALEYFELADGFENSNDLILQLKDEKVG